MRHAILGPGGVGGLIGSCLARAGSSVTLVGRPGAVDSYPRKIHLESIFGNFSVPVEVAEVVPATDVLWITVKATQLDAALESFPKGELAGAIVPLLNGIDHVQSLRAKYGASRVIPATIAVEAERVSPGYFVHRSPFAILNMASQGREMLGEPVSQLQQQGFTCQFVEDEPTLLWRKLVFLAPLALVSTFTAKTTGEIFANPEWWQLLQSAIRETCAVALAENAKVDVEVVISTIRKLPGNMRSSMQKDVAQNKPPELDAIAGPILRGAERHGIGVPVMSKLAAEIARRISL